MHRPGTNCRSNRVRRNRSADVPRARRGDLTEAEPQGIVLFVPYASATTPERVQPKSRAVVHATLHAGWYGLACGVVHPSMSERTVLAENA